MSVPKSSRNVTAVSEKRRFRSMPPSISSTAPLSELNTGDEEEIEIDEGEAEIAFYEGKGIELEQIIAEQILLLLPMQMVCKEACKGICPACGENRNQTECKCQSAPASDRWSALKDLAS